MRVFPWNNSFSSLDDTVCANKKVRKATRGMHQGRILDGI